MSTRRRLPRAPTATFGSTVLLEGEIAYDQSLKRFRMGDGTTPAGKVVALLDDAAAAPKSLPGFGGVITGGTNPANTYLMVIDGAVLVRPSDGVTMLATGLNISVDMTRPGPVKNGRDTATGLSANEQGYVYLIANSMTGEKALIASQQESYLNVTRPAGFDFVCPYVVCWYTSDVGSNLRNILIYGRRHTYVKHQDGNGMPLVASGPAGDPSKGVYVSKSIALWVPRQAHTVVLSIGGYNGATKVAPDPDYDGGGGSGSGLPYGARLINTGVTQQVTLQIEDYYDRAIWYASDDTYAHVGVYGFFLSFGTVGG